MYSGCCVGKMLVSVDVVGGKACISRCTVGKMFVSVNVVGVLLVSVDAVWTNEFITG